VVGVVVAVALVEVVLVLVVVLMVATYPPGCDTPAHAKRTVAVTPESAVTRSRIKKAVRAASVARRVPILVNTGLG
jgi:hypothetical protein